MNVKRITIIQLIITLVLVISLFFVFDYKVSLGILLGSGLGYFDFYYLNKKLNEVSDIEVPDLKRIVKKNRNFRYLVMLLVLLISGFLPMIFNLIATCLSVLINKLSVYIDVLISKK